MVDFSNISAADILALEYADEEETKAAEGRVNAFKALMGQPQTWRASAGTGSSALRSYATSRGKEIEGLISEALGQAILDNTVTDMDSFNVWYTSQPFPARHRDTTRTAFRSYMGERRSEDVRGEQELAAGYASATAGRADLQEKERIAVDA